MNKNKYTEIIKGEVELIYEELENFQNLEFGSVLNISATLDSMKKYLLLIENKIGTNSIDYITISTEIVDVISIKIQSYFEYLSSNNFMDNKSATETVQIFSNQRKNLEVALAAFRIMDCLNMDYAYRVKKFNKIKENIENRCIEKGIDIRTTSQKSIDQLKTVGSITGEVAKSTAGCAIEFAFKVVIVIIIFKILIAIIGVK